MSVIGCRAAVVADPVQGAGIPVRWLYPAATDAVVRDEAFGPFTVEVAMDALVAPGAGPGARLPLVLVSHGTGSTPWLHRGLGLHLARAGFVVGLVQHPGNCRGDDGLAGTLENLINRPRHVRLVIDAAFADAALGPRLAPGVAVVGHSLGGYTALAVAGGEPSAFPWEVPLTKQDVPEPFSVDHDARVRALVLLAPATPWFAARGALAGVRVPVLMRTGGKDEHAEPLFARIVEQGLPAEARLDHVVVAGAGHFSFVSAYPPVLASPSIPPSQDPEGFDRTAYLPVLFGDIERFLRADPPA